MSDDTLRAVPQSATMLMAGKLDFAKILSLVRDVGAKFDPNVPNMINSGLALANAPQWAANMFVGVVLIASLAVPGLQRAPAGRRRLAWARLRRATA